MMKLMRFTLSVMLVVGVTNTFAADKRTYEAEDAAHFGGVHTESVVEGFTGTGYVSGFEKSEDKCVFRIDIEKEGFYDLIFVSMCSSGAYKENVVQVDEQEIGSVPLVGGGFTDSIYPRVYLESGAHAIGLAKGWGWIKLDKLVVTPSELLPADVYDVSPKLIDSKADDNTKRLMSFLTDIYGKKMLTGQYSHGINGRECHAIRSVTGKSPAVLGLDFIGLAGSQRTRGGRCSAVESALEFDKLGGIVQLIWHWGVPEKYRIRDGGGFYIQETNIDLKKIMDGEDQEGYDLLISDMDEVAEALKKLQAAGVPVLWRPLHEASGAWFWWGAFGKDTFIKFWKLMYHRFTHEHQLHNLIWIWNGQAKDWYPGDDYVDIIGEDIYTGARVYSSQTQRFLKALDYTPQRKMIVLSENCCIFDPDHAVRDGAMWGFYATWNGVFVVKNRREYSEQYTEESILKKAYHHKAMLALEDLPPLKEYPIKISLDGVF